MSGRRLIHLVDVAKSYAQAGQSPRVVLVPGTISLPSDGRLAVLAGRRDGKTTLLQLLSGVIKPDQGAVVGADVRSPVVNAGSSLMHPQLSAIDNLKFLARAYGFDPDTLLMAVDALNGSDMLLDRPLKGQDGAKRRNFEAATTFVIPFGCYLVDDLGQLDPDLIERCLALAAHRRSGVVFTTSQPRVATQYADAAVTIDDGVLHLFHDVRDAVDAYEANRRS